MASDELKQPWHALDSSEVLRLLDAQAEGLSPEEAASRLARYGPNRLPEGRRVSPLRRLLRQFHNLLIYVLLAAGLIAALLGETVDTLVILAVVLINAAIGFVQEGRAEASLLAIRAMIDPHASVVRAGRRTTIPAADVVPGDVVWLEAGDRVPADLRLLRARSLRVDEAILTGESVPADKDVAVVAADAALGDRHGTAFSGTLVAAGHGLGVVTGTGEATELGRIGTLLGSVVDLQTPLLRKLDGFARQVSVAVLGIGALVLVLAIGVRGESVADAFMIMIGLVVAAIPEGLPAIVTITLAIGVRRMAQRHAIIRRLPAVETLGSVSVICSDKTGTLTRNEMTVTQVVTPARTLGVGGAGYAPDGTFSHDGMHADAVSDDALQALARSAALCNDAELRATDGVWHVDGDPMEGALVTLAVKAGIDTDALRASHPRLDQIPFDPALRYMATLHGGADGPPLLVVKGAPEQILEMCRFDGEASAARARWAEAASALARSGHRVLAFAHRNLSPGRATLEPGDVAASLQLLGLAGFIDPPRPEAHQAITECHGAGIRVVMITGDHVDTAREIARQLGIAAAPRALSGHELESMDDTATRAAVRDTDVFARTTPEHKLRLVSALQAEGLTVAMTGDGVNDAPALKRANVGVAMGIKGTEVAKQAAEMVLADDNFASIVAAVREGRTVYDNIVKVIAWTLPTNGGEALTIVIALALGLAMPITPLQILWINMVTAVALGLTLAFEPEEPGVMQRPPQPANRSLLNRLLIWRVVFVALLFVGGAFGIFYWAQSRGLPLETARTLVVNTIVGMEVAYLFSVRYVHGSALTWRGVLGTPAVLAGVATVVVAQLALTYLPLMQQVFATRPLSLLELLAICAISALLLGVVEIEKRLLHRR